MEQVQPAQLKDGLSRCKPSWKKKECVRMMTKKGGQRCPYGAPQRGNYETTPHRVAAAAAPATPGGVDLRVRHCEFLGSGEWGSRLDTYPLFSSPPLPLLFSVDGGTRALMLKLSGRVGRSMRGGGGLLRLLLPPFSLVSEAPSRRLFFRRCANEREGSSRGSKALPVRFGRTRFILR